MVVLCQPRKMKTNISNSFYFLNVLNHITIALLLFILKIQGQKLTLSEIVRDQFLSRFILYIIFNTIYKFTLNSHCSNYEYLHLQYLLYIYTFRDNI